MQVPQPAFSDWFKKRIDDAKLSHTGFAERTGLSLSTVNNLKAGHSGYRKYTLSRVLRAFGIKMSLKDFLSELAAGGDPGGVDPERKLNTNVKKTRPFMPMLTVILLTLILAVFFAWRNIPTPAIRLVTKSPDERNILLHTENGEVVEIPVGDKILDPFRVKVGDEQLIVTVPYELPLNYEPATVLVFDSTGMERWAYNLYDSTFLSFSPPYNTATLSAFFKRAQLVKETFSPICKTSRFGCLPPKPPTRSLVSLFSI